MQVVRWISTIFCIAGAVLLYFAFREYLQQSAFIARAQAAEGEVLEVIRTRARRSGNVGFRAIVYYFRFRYTTSAGEVREFQTTDSMNSPEYQVGDRVPILYDPDDPSAGSINSFPYLWSAFGLALVLGLTFLGSGATNLWITVKPARGKIRTEAKIPELVRAFRAGTLTRDSEFQPLLVAFSFVGFAMLGALAMVYIFSTVTTKVIVSLFLAFGVIQALRGMRASRKKE